MKKTKIALGSDHAGFHAKANLIKFLTNQGFEIVDYGAFTDAPSDYPDYAYPVAKAVVTGGCGRGILICGSGAGMQIAANKIRGIRAVACWTIPLARYSAQHNWCNILCLPARFASSGQIKKIANTWLKTPFERGGRHERRVKKIIKIESKFCTK